MGKELYNCKVTLSKNDIDKMLKSFGKNSVYKKYIKSLKDNYEVLFYEDYLVYVTDEETKYLYSDFNNVIETDTEFYFMTDSDVVYIPKRDMDYKFNSFVRRTFDNIDNKIGEDIGIGKIGKFHDSKVMKKVLLVLFILSIVAVFLGLITWLVVIEYLNVPSLLEIKYRWVVLFYLPIPIISTVLGFIYNNRGHDCLKNIIAGFISFFCILGFGVTSFRLENMMLEFQKEMSYLDNYKEMMKIHALPKDGQLYYFEDSQCYVGYDEKDCTLIYSYFEDYEKFEEYLFKSEYWILDENKLDNFDLFFIDTDYKSYYLLYNKTLNEYNTIPLDNGSYEMYIFEYVPEMALLRISELVYEVK